MESYSVQPFETSFSRLAQCCWGVSKQVCITVVHSLVAVNFQSYDFSDLHRLCYDCCVCSTHHVSIYVLDRFLHQLTYTPFSDISLLGSFKAHGVSLLILFDPFVYCIIFHYMEVMTLCMPALLL